MSVKTVIKAQCGPKSFLYLHKIKTIALINQTSIQFDKVIARCREIFTKKNRDYGTAWRILRPESITDQIFIKAQRIRSLEAKGNSRVNEGIEPEYIGIVNYCVIALIQLSLGKEAPVEIPTDEILKKYDEEIAITRQLMEDKNHDYGEAWRDMRIATFTDLILMKLFRVKQIEDNNGQTIVSEGVDANYRDIINYSVFALIRIDEEEAKK